MEKLSGMERLERKWENYLEPAPLSLRAGCNILSGVLYSADMPECKNKMNKIAKPHNQEIRDIQKINVEQYISKL